MERMMTKYVHIVYVHPVENGEPNLHKVKYEQEFDTKDKAEYFVELYDILNNSADIGEQAVYYGCVNVETGELV
jgi:hypothetical protein